MIYKIILFSLFIFSCSATSKTSIPKESDNLQVKDTSLNSENQVSDRMLPRLKIKEGNVFHISKSEIRFIEKEITIMNNGGSDLVIQNVRASCSCSSGKVIQGKVMPMSTGKIVLSVNKDGLDNGVGSIEFLIDSNSKDSPHSVRINVE